jgi:hypothetical protein
MIGQSETGNSSQIIFITLFSGKVFSFCCCASLTKPQARPCKNKCWAKLACFDIQFSFAGSLSHILSTGGVAAAAQALCHDVRVEERRRRRREDSSSKNLHYQQRNAYNRIRCSQLRRGECWYGTSWEQPTDDVNAFFGMVGGNKWGIMLPHQVITGR